MKNVKVVPLQRNAFTVLTEANGAARIRRWTLVMGGVLVAPVPMVFVFPPVLFGGIVGAMLLWAAKNAPLFRRRITVIG